MKAARPVREGLFRVDGDGAVLLGGGCAACGRAHFPRAEICPWCAAAECGERDLAGRGRLWLHTAVNTAPPGYRGAVPFGFGVVELDDGLRVITRLSEADPARLRAGMPMRLVVDELHVDDDGCSVLGYSFAPVE